MEIAQHNDVQLTLPPHSQEMIWGERERGERGGRGFGDRNGLGEGRV